MHKHPHICLRPDTSWDKLAKKFYFMEPESLLPHSQNSIIDPLLTHLNLVYPFKPYVYQAFQYLPPY
jgi:hypothetical protein